MPLQQQPTLLFHSAGLSALRAVDIYPSKTSWGVIPPCKRCATLHSTRDFGLCLSALISTAKGLHNWMITEQFAVATRRTLLRCCLGPAFVVRLAHC
jgi:hypothetical protein